MAVEQIRPVRDIDYYLSEPALYPVTFEGKGAKLLGIEGDTATPQSVHQLFAGRTPDGVRLPKYMHKERRGAFEVTVNLPKCGSVLGELAGDSRIKDVLRDVAGEVAEYLQKQACVRVSKGNFKGMDRRPDNLVYSVYVHPTSRAGDPHLHAHIVFYNLSYDRHEKAWKAIETRYIDQPGMGRLANRAMTKGLRQLGYRLAPKGKEFEIVGVPAEVKAEFSRRGEQVRALKAEYDRNRGDKPMSVKERSKLALYDRPEKVLADAATRHASWVSRITGQQFGSLKSLAQKAKDRVRLARLGRNLQKHIDNTRSVEQTHEQGRGYER